MPDHDTGYHLLFSHPELVRDLLTLFVGEDRLGEVDWATLRRESTKLQARGGARRALERRSGDLLWSARLAGVGERRLYVPLEFQSTPERWMGLRALGYVSLLLQRLVKEGGLTAGGGLPPVLLVVVYNGLRPWRPATEVGDLIDLPPTHALWTWQPGMRYCVVDAGRIGEARLAALDSPVAALFRLEHVASPSALLGCVDHLIRSLEGRSDALRRDFLSWLQQSRAAERFGFSGVDLRSFSGVKDMLDNLAERMDQWEWEFQERGRREGQAAGLRAAILAVARSRFGAEAAEAARPLLQAIPEPDVLEGIAEAIGVAADAPTLLRVVRAGLPQP